MKTFPEFPEEANCPICGTNSNTECWLMPVTGTETGRNIEAVPVHVSCSGSYLVGKLQYIREHRIVYTRAYDNTLRSNG